MVDDVEHHCGHFRQEDTNPLQGIAFRVGEYATRRVGATEPIDPMTVRMKMQISSGTPPDIIRSGAAHSGARWQKLERYQGPGGEIGSRKF
jgi:hypothetical protein